MATDTQKVDVLAVLDKHIKAERDLGYEASAREGEEARKAVAELIKTLRYLDRIGGLGFSAHYRITAALARIGGAA